MLRTFIKGKGYGTREWGKGRKPLAIRPLPFALSKGFTLLELLVTIAVIAIVLSVSTSLDLDNWNAQKTFTNTFNSLQSELSSLRNEALMRNTTTRIVITSSSGTYTINTYYSPSPVSTCSSAGSWTSLVSSRTLSMHSKYQMTGSAMSNICFYRDGTSSGGTLTIAPITANSALKTAVVTITMATGYLDVAVQ